jgi:hypothetical protein
VGRLAVQSDSEPNIKSTISAIEDAEAAILDARAEKISISEMLNIILTSQVLIPLAEPPEIEERILKSWNPATVTEQNENTQFVVAFSNKELASDFYKSNPSHTYEFFVNTQWLLSVLPENHGIIFNLGGESNFEWSANGIVAFLAQADQNAC